MDVPACALLGTRFIGTLGPQFLGLDIHGIDWAGGDTGAASGAKGRIDNRGCLAADGKLEGNGLGVAAITADAACDAAARQARGIYQCDQGPGWFAVCVLQGLRFARFDAVTAEDAFVFVEIDNWITAAGLFKNEGGTSINAVVATGAKFLKIALSNRPRGPDNRGRMTKRVAQKT